MKRSGGVMIEACQDEIIEAKGISVAPCQGLGGIVGVLVPGVPLLAPPLATDWRPIRGWKAVRFPSDFALLISFVIRISSFGFAPPWLLTGTLFGAGNGFAPNVENRSDTLVSASMTAC